RASARPPAAAPAARPRQVPSTARAVEATARPAVSRQPAAQPPRTRLTEAPRPATLQLARATSR
ncbi:hypothetical protein ACI6QG_02790, partial [Roseococcus sp. DSY-14]